MLVPAAGGLVVGCIGALAHAGGDDAEVLEQLQAALRPVRVGEALADRVAEALGEPISGKTIAVLGLTFKPNTDDLRESPALDVISLLKQKGADVSYTDPHVPELEERIPEIRQSMLGALKNVRPGHLMDADLLRALGLPGAANSYATPPRPKKPSIRRQRMSATWASRTAGGEGSPITGASVSDGPGLSSRGPAW